MTTREAYIIGFCKAAQDANTTGTPPATGNGNSTSIFDGMSDWWNTLDDPTKHSLIGGLLGTAGSFMFSRGDFTDRLMKSILGGGVAAAGTYGLSASGALKDIHSWASDRIKDLTNGGNNKNPPSATV